MSSVRYSAFPRTRPGASFISELLEVFRHHEPEISTEARAKGHTSDGVLMQLRPELVALGFSVEAGKQASQKIERPVFFGENGVPSVRYEIDAYHPGWRCGLEVEAGRSWMGNAVYRDLILASMMVDVDYFVLAVPNNYKFKTGGKDTVSRDYEKTVALADTIYSHGRLPLPYELVVIGY